MLSVQWQRCSSSFKVPEYRRHTARFCSTDCRRTGISRPCSYCGSPVYRSASQARENVYCSVACSAPHTRFRTGQVPWNKDRKGIHLSPGSEFKPGPHPQSRAAIGTVRLRVDRQGDPRAWVKVADPNRWMLRAHCVWCEAHGPLPAGHVIHHHDRDKLNDALPNLECLTKLPIWTNTARKSWRHDGRVAIELPGQPSGFTGGLSNCPCGLRSHDRVGAPRSSPRSGPDVSAAPSSKSRATWMWLSGGGKRLAAGKWCGSPRCSLMIWRT
jgi:hypothetical protein